jgi:hypothetical protein
VACEFLYLAKSLCSIFPRNHHSEDCYIIVFKTIASYFAHKYLFHPNFSGFRRQNSDFHPLSVTHVLIRSRKMCTKALPLLKVTVLTSRTTYFQLKYRGSLIAEVHTLQRCYIWVYHPSKRNTGIHVSMRHPRSHIIAKDTKKNSASHDAPLGLTRMGLCLLWKGLYIIAEKRNAF